jgi:hypothetical protein
MKSSTRPANVLSPDDYNHSALSPLSGDSLVPPMTQRVLRIERDGRATQEGARILRTGA